MYVRLLWWSLRRRRWRHAVNALITALTVAVLMLFVAVTVELVAVARVASERQLVRILVWPRLALPGQEGIPVAFFPMLQKIDGVKAVTRSIVIGGSDPSGATYLVAGEDDAGLPLTADFFPVTADVVDAWKRERTGAVVTEQTMAELKLSVGAVAEIGTESGPLQIKVVGVSRGSLVPHRIAVHFEYLQQAMNNLETCDYRVYAAPGDVDRVVSAIVDVTSHTSTPAKAFSDTELTTTWVRHVSVVPALLGFLGAFLMFTTALTLANNTAIAIRERRAETATLRTLGFRKSTIVRVMLGEAVLVGLIGGLFSVAMTALVVRGGVQLTPGAERLLQKVTLSGFAIGCGLAASIVIPLLGALPAVLASVRKPLVDALRDSA